VQDTFLLNKISQSLKRVCEENKIKRINAFTLVLSRNSHVNEENLMEHLKLNNRDIIDDNIKIELKRDDIEDQAAIIYCLKGDTNR
jgi:Zn finger protein HypA/HybF involved in hydrogenase expression